MDLIFPDVPLQLRHGNLPARKPLLLYSPSAAGIFSDLMQFHALFIGKPIEEHIAQRHFPQTSGIQLFTSSRSQAFIHLIQRTALHKPKGNQPMPARNPLLSVNRELHALFQILFPCVFCRYFTDYFFKWSHFVIFVFFLLTFLSHAFLLSPLVPSFLVLHIHQFPVEFAFLLQVFYLFQMFFHPFSCKHCMS